MRILLILSFMFLLGCKAKKEAAGLVGQQGTTAVEKKAELQVEEVKQKQETSIVQNEEPTKPNESEKRNNSEDTEPINISVEELSNGVSVELKDDFFTIDNAEIMGQRLKVNVTYSGGCGNAEFRAVWNGMAMKSMPPKVNLKLYLDDSDNCEALISKQIIIDLSKFKQVSADRVLIRLAGKDEPMMYNSSSRN
jgi:hypothetical protein